MFCLSRTALLAVSVRLLAVAVLTLSCSCCCPGPGCGASGSQIENMIQEGYRLWGGPIAFAGFCQFQKSRPLFTKLVIAYILAVAIYALVQGGACRRRVNWYVAKLAETHTKRCLQCPLLVHCALLKQHIYNMSTTLGCCQSSIVGSTSLLRGKVLGCALLNANTQKAVRWSDGLLYYGNRPGNHVQWSSVARLTVSSTYESTSCIWILQNTVPVCPFLALSLFLWFL